MMYKYHRIIGIRKMKWDSLWHILYKIGDRITWDRVPMNEALSVLTII